MEILRRNLLEFLMIKSHKIVYIKLRMEALYNKVTTSELLHISFHFFFSASLLTIKLIRFIFRSSPPQKIVIELSMFLARRLALIVHEGTTEKVERAKNVNSNVKLNCTDSELKYSI